MNERRRLRNCTTIKRDSDHAGGEAGTLARSRSLQPRMRRSALVVLWAEGVKVATKVAVWPAVEGILVLNFDLITFPSFKVKVLLT